MFKIKEIVSREQKVSKTNNPYTSFIFTITDGRRVSGFGDSVNAEWKPGDIILDNVAVIEQNGKWYNLKMLVKPDKKDAKGTESEILKSLDELHGKLDVMQTTVNKILSQFDGNEGLEF